MPMQWKNPAACENAKKIPQTNPLPMAATKTRATTRGILSMSVPPNAARCSALHILCEVTRGAAERLLNAVGDWSVAAVEHSSKKVKYQFDHFARNLRLQQSGPVLVGRDREISNVPPRDLRDFSNRVGKRECSPTCKLISSAIGLNPAIRDRVKSGHRGGRRHDCFTLHRCVSARIRFVDSYQLTVQMIVSALSQIDPPRYGPSPSASY